MKNNLTNFFIENEGDRFSDMFKSIKAILRFYRHSGFPYYGAEGNLTLQSIQHPQEKLLQQENKEEITNDETSHTLSPIKIKYAVRHTAITTDLYDLLVAMPRLVAYALMSLWYLIKSMLGSMLAFFTLGSRPPRVSLKMCFNPLDAGLFALLQCGWQLVLPVIVSIKLLRGFYFKLIPQHHNLFEPIEHKADLDAELAISQEAPIDEAAQYPEESVAFNESIALYDTGFNAGSLLQY